MPNVIVSRLYAEGQIELVDRFIDEELSTLLTEPDELRTQYGAMYEWRVKHFGVAWLNHDIKAVRDADGIKTVLIRCESPWTPPYSLFLDAIRKCHRNESADGSGLQFHLFWDDADGGYGPDPLFGDDWVHCGETFGELYTEPICDQNGRVSWFGDEQGEFTFVAVSTIGSADEVEITRSWFEERGFTVKGEREGLDLVRAAYPDHVVLVAKWPVTDEVLHDWAVINRTEKLNEVILETWGAQWFVQRDKALGAVRFEDLSSEEYDSLIGARYGSR